MKGEKVNKLISLRMDSSNILSLKISEEYRTNGKFVYIPMISKKSQHLRNVP